MTRPGLPLPPGEPAINPAPRAMIRANLGEVAERLCVGVDLNVEISIPGGAKIAERTANGRLGIVGGLSILGTTGVVVPYSCSAWIHSIHSGVDVARASGCTHIGAATGETSEAAIRALYRLPDHALIEMGEFRRRLFEAPARPPGRARHHRRRAGEDDEARRGHARSPLEARRGRSRRARRADLRRRRAAFAHACGRGRQQRAARLRTRGWGRDSTCPPLSRTPRGGRPRASTPGLRASSRSWSSAAAGACWRAAGSGGFRAQALLNCFTLTQADLTGSLC